MPVDVHVDPLHTLVTITVHGAADAATVAATMRQLHQDPRLTPEMNRLWDLRAANLVLTSTDIHRLVMTFLAQPARHRPHRTAVVTSSTLAYGLSRMASAYVAASQLPVLAEVFDTLEEALLWLHHTPDPRTSVESTAASDLIEPVAEDAPLPHGPRVLIVDDDVLLADTARRLLRRALPAVAVAIAPSGAAALTWLATRSAQVVLADVTMPVMDGVQLARAIAGRWPHIRVLLATGYTASPIALDGVPIAGSLAKPFRGAELAEAVRTALGGHQID